MEDVISEENNLHLGTMCLKRTRARETDGTILLYRTTSFSALSSFSATPRLVRPPYTRIIRPF